MNQPLIELENVFKKFGEKQILNGVNLSIYKGAVTTIIGASTTRKFVTPVTTAKIERVEQKGTSIRNSSS